MKHTFSLFLSLLLSIITYGQNVGVNETGATADNSAMLDVQSTDKGLLIPRVSLIARNNTAPVTSPATSLMVYNTSTSGSGANVVTPGFYYWNGTVWVRLVDQDTRDTYVGKFIISGSGNITISGIPFQPTSVEFKAYGNVENYTLNSDNGVGNNNGGIPNSFNYMSGYARNYSGTAEQQVICGGGSGNSINDISRYASLSHCVGIRYGNQNGNSLGLTTAEFINFTSDGFVINVDNFSDGLVVLFTAHR